MAKVSFGSCTAVQLAAKVTSSALVPRRIYFVTNGTILSIVHALTNNNYLIVYQDAIASKPSFSSKGHLLSYIDASGATKLIDMKSMTVGDRTDATDSGQLPVSNLPTGVYRGKLGVGEEYTALPTTGVSVDDYFLVATAATYNSIACVVGDRIRALSITPSWEKDTTVETPSGRVKNTDTLAKALARIQNRLTSNESGLSDKASLAYVDMKFIPIDSDITLQTERNLTLYQDPTEPMHAATKQYVDATVVSFMKLQASPASVAVFNALTGIKVGYSYRITVAGTYAGQVCEIGDIIVAIAVTTGATATTTWMVLQNNIDLAGVFTTVGAGLEETAGAGGKTVRMPVINQSNTTNGSATIAFGGTVTVVDSVTRDSYGRVTGINVKTMTMHSETVLSGLSANAQSAYKVMVNMTSSGHAMTATYADFLALVMTGWSTDGNVGNIVAGDTLKVALNRLQNRAGALESRTTAVEALQDWIDG